MNYIRLLNAFNDLMRTEALPAAAQVLYFKLLDIWNRSGRRTWVSVSNQRLMVESVIRDEKTLIRNRDKLIHTDVINFKSGKKGQPSRYCIKKIYWDNSSEYDSINASVNASEYDSENASTNARHNRDRVRDRDNALRADADAHEDNSHGDMKKAKQAESVKNHADVSTSASVYASLFASENKDVLDVYIAKFSLSPSPNELHFLSDFLDVYGKDTVLKAIERAGKRSVNLSGIRAIKYIGAILRDWKANGYDEDGKNKMTPALPKGIQELENIMRERD